MALNRHAAEYDLALVFDGTIVTRRHCGDIDPSLWASGIVRLRPESCVSINRYIYDLQYSGGIAGVSLAWS